MNELRQFDVLEQVTFIQELQETVERLSPLAPEPQWYLKTNASLSPEQQEYLRAKDNLERAEAYDDYREKWSQPRYRLKADFKQYVDSLFPKPGESPE